MSLQPHAIPKDGFAGTGGANIYQASTGTSGFNSTTDVFGVGTKVRYRNKTLNGNGTCIYLRYSHGAGTVTIDSGSFVLLDKDGTGAVTADVTDHEPNCALGAIALGVVDNDSYGWFWCGGVAPDFYTADGVKFAHATGAESDVNSVKTDNSVVAATDVIAAAADEEIKIAITTAVSKPIGFALDSDGTGVLGAVSLIMYDNWG